MLPLTSLQEFQKCDEGMLYCLALMTARWISIAVDRLGILRRSGILIEHALHLLVENVHAACFNFVHRHTHVVQDGREIADHNHDAPEKTVHLKLSQASPTRPRVSHPLPQVCHGNASSNHEYLRRPVSR